MMVGFVALVLAGCTSWVTTAYVRRYALQRGMIDIPNERSSHTEPTPRGGGVGVFVGVGSAMTIFALSDITLPQGTIGIVLGAVMISAIGWLDDRYDLSPKTRAAVQAVAATVAVYGMGALPALNLGFASLELGTSLGMFLCVVGIMWSVNLFNFMDGADGLAGSEAVFVAGAMGILAWYAADRTLGLLAGAVAAANLGFLYWNWPPAKIFMGDVGSGLNGYLFAVLAILGERSRSVMLLLTAILAGAFVFDATLTLIRRVLRGDRWYAPHREHAYQRLIRSGWSHRSVLWWAMKTNLGLAFLALIAYGFPRWILPAFIFALAIWLVVYRRVERALPMVGRRSHGSLTASTGEITLTDSSPRT